MNKFLLDTLKSALGFALVMLLLGVGYNLNAEPELTCPAPVDEVDCYDLAPGVYICTDPVDLPTYSI
jgi:hypothetical protein